MNYIFSIIICLLIIVAGFYVRKSQNAKLIAGYDANDKSIDKAKVTKQVGNGVMVIGALNILVIIIYLIANKVAGFDNPSILNWSECIVTVIGAAGIIFVTNKK